MFQDDIYPPDVVIRHHQTYARMSETVTGCLKNYLWIVEQMHKLFAASKSDIHVVPTMLLLELAEPIDGVAILSKVGSAKNCFPLLRSGMEIQAGIMYLFEDDAKYEQRCHSYEYFHFLDELKFAQACDPTTERGRQVRQKTQDEDMADLFDQDVAEEISRINEKLAHARFAFVRAELARKKAKNWYALWDGPVSFEALCSHLAKQTDYEILYRYWSASSHGEAALNRMNEHKREMDPLRCPAGLPNACRLACAFANLTTVHLIERKLPTLIDEWRKRHTEVVEGLKFIDSIKGL